MNLRISHTVACVKQTQFIGDVTFNLGLNETSTKQYKINAGQLRESDIFMTVASRGQHTLGCPFEAHAVTVNLNTNPLCLWNKSGGSAEVESTQMLLL